MFAIFVRILTLRLVRRNLPSYWSFDAIQFGFRLSTIQCLNTPIAHIVVGKWLFRRFVFVKEEKKGRSINLICHLMRASEDLPLVVRSPGHRLQSQTNFRNAHISHLKLAGLALNFGFAIVYPQFRDKY